MYRAISRQIKIKITTTITTTTPLPNSASKVAGLQVHATIPHKFICFQTINQSFSFLLFILVLLAYYPKVNHLPRNTPNWKLIYSFKSAPIWRNSVRYGELTRHSPICKTPPPLSKSAKTYQRITCISRLSKVIVQN